MAVPARPRPLLPAREIVGARSRKLKRSERDDEEQVVSRIDFHRNSGHWRSTRICEMKSSTPNRDSHQNALPTQSGLPRLGRGPPTVSFANHPNTLAPCQLMPRIIAKSTLHYLWNRSNPSMSGPDCFRIGDHAALRDGQPTIVNGESKDGNHENRSNRR